MEIYPAIDLLNGDCVRLYQGQFATKKSYAHNPISVAENFRNLGAKFLHVVDLDGAQAQMPKQLALIEKIIDNTHLKVQFGGGIRKKQHIVAAFDSGVERVIVGSCAITNPAQVVDWLNEFGADKIVLGLDVRLDKSATPYLVTHGWQNTTETTLWDLLAFYEKNGCRHILCTDINRDGALCGPNVELYHNCQEHFSTLNFQASGGISSMNDVKQLRQISIAGAIIGKALYEQKLCLTELWQEVM